MPVLESCASVVARVLAGLAVLAFIVLLPVTMLARNIAVVIFEPQALTQVVSERLIESGLLRQTVVDNLFGAEAGLEGVSLQSATQYLTPAEREALIDLLVPAAWVRDQVLQVTTDLFAWFDTPATQLVLTVDTSSLAARLGGEAAAGAVETIVASWPACTLEDVGQLLGLGVVPGQEGFPYCEPPEPLRGVLVRMFAGALRLMGEGLPARLPIVNRDFGEAENLMQVKEQVRLVRFVARWGVLVSLSLLGVIMVLAVRSWRGLTRWWGFPLLFGGMIAFLPVLLGGAFLRLILAQLSAGLGGIPALSEMAQALGGAIGAAVLKPQAWQAAIATGLGVVLLVLSPIGRRSRKATVSRPSEVPAASPPPLIEPTAPADPKDRPSGMFG
jgi:hypothetical protein